MEVNSFSFSCFQYLPHYRRGNYDPTSDELPVMSLKSRAVVFGVCVMQLASDLRSGLFWHEEFHFNDPDSFDYALSSVSWEALKASLFMSEAPKKRHAINPQTSLNLECRSEVTNPGEFWCPGTEGLDVAFRQASGVSQTAAFWLSM